MADPREPAEVDYHFASLVSFMAAESLESALAEATRHLGTVSGAVVSGLVVVLHGNIFLESWLPTDTAQPAKLRSHFHRLAIQAAQQSAPALATLPEDSGITLNPSVYVFPLKHKLTGVLCLGRPPGTERSESGSAIVTRMIDLVALRLRAIQDMEAERQKSVKYERWFHISVRQIRALDCERQKFVALADSIGACIFVADRTGTIQWLSRSLLERFPETGTKASWVGRSCKELCRQIAGADALACGTCMVPRVLDSRSAERCDLRTGGSELGHVIHASAHPIKDVEGRAQEVLVLFQEHDQAEYPKAA